MIGAAGGVLVRVFSSAGGKGRAAPKPLTGSTLSSSWRSVSAPFPEAVADTRDQSHNAPAAVSIAVRGTQDQSRSVAAAVLAAVPTAVRGAQDQSRSVVAAVPAALPDTQDRRRRTMPAGAREIPPASHPCVASSDPLRLTRGPPNRHDRLPARVALSAAQASFKIKDVCIR